MNKLLWVPILCLGCSLVNNTSDLRNDVGRSDGGPAFDGSPGFDSESSEGGVDADGVDGGSCVLPDVEDLDVILPHNPPLLRVRFVEPPRCSGSLSVEVRRGVKDEDSFAFEVNVDSSVDDEVLFEYLGPRVPLIDDYERMRTFIFREGQTDADMHTLVMPVERLRVLDEGAATVVAEFSFAATAHVDIDNHGNVVFDSNESDALDVEPSNLHNAFRWTIAPRMTADEGIWANVEVIYPGGRAPVVSDMGDAIAFITGSGSEATVRVYDSAERESAALRGLDGVPLGHLDLRNSDAGRALLVHVSSGAAGSPGNRLFLSDELGFNESTTGFVAGGPGTLGAMDDEVGFVALDGTSVLEFRDGLMGFRTYADGLGGAEGLPFVALGPAREDGEAAYRCIEGEDAQLCVRGVAYDVRRMNTELDEAWQLISADAELEQLLLRNETSGTSSPYVLVEIEDEADAPDLTVVDLDGFGQPLRADVRVEDTTTSAALSPDGEWLVYTFRRDDSVPRMEVYRIPVDNEVPYTPPE